ncbi:MAG: TMEM165/GDT1 family protein [Firmicutes bacterium]|nr:TMEM165/GDT1 family protein [Bacillota bacterium]
MLQELGKSSFLIFLAEMGDKTQILAMAFALQYSLRQVLSGVALGAFCNHSLAVILGVYLAQLIPLEFLQLVASLLFLVFGFWALLPGEEGPWRESKSRGNPILIVAAAFFIGELGDKTQLTAIVLASNASYPLGVLAGTVLGMVLTSLVGMFVGVKLGEHIPEFVLKLISGGVFIGFGLLGLWPALRPGVFDEKNVIIFFLLAIIILFFLITWFRRWRQKEPQGRLKQVAGNLRLLNSALNELCLGEVKCLGCRKERCPVGYCRSLIEGQIGGRNTDLPFAHRINPHLNTNQHFDQKKTEKVLSLLEKTDLKPEVLAEIKINLEKLKQT